MRAMTPPRPAPPKRSPVTDLRLGLEHHRAGRLREAEACYRTVLRAAPRQPDALGLLGLLCLGEGRNDEARALFGRLVDVRPDVADYRSNLGHVMRLQGEARAALTHLTAATTLDPECADAWINLGLAHLDLDEVALAVPALERAVTLVPGSAAAHLNLGAALERQGRLDAAATHLHEAARLAPELAAPWRNLGLVHVALGDDAGAVAALLRAVALDGDDPEVRTNLGVLLARQGDLPAAMLHHDHAVHLAPEMADAWLNRGTTLHHCGRLAEAFESLSRAAALGGGAPATTALGSVLADQGDLPGAIVAHQDALAAAPDFADGHWNLALALLAAGDVARGWDEYEWRWQASSRVATLRPYPFPAWRGEPLDGRRILVWREQGLGDELMFLTMTGDLVRMGARVTLLVSGRLVALVQRAYPTATVLADSADAAGGAEFDFHVPMGSLPVHLRRSLDAFGEPGRCVVPSRAASERWAERLESVGPGKRIGVCWRSGLVTADRRRRYPALEAWAPIWSVPGIAWVNLQYDDCAAELRQLEAAHGLTIHRWAGDDLRDDLDSVAGLLSALDGVVTAPTAVSSLAGATGVPTWQVDDGSDWTALGRDRSPWFPSIARVCGGVEGGWDDTMRRLAAELASFTLGASR